MSKKSGRMSRPMRPTMARADKIRKAPAPVHQDDKGRVAILCPFCSDHHALPLKGEAACGAQLEIVATQQTYRNVSCALCGQPGGTLIKIGENYRHSHDCKPGYTLFKEPPKRSRSAGLFWHVPQAVHRFLWKNFRLKVMQVFVGGKVSGYAWEKHK